MQHSRAKCMTVYSSLRCRQMFCKPENAALRKQKSIKAVIRRHRLTVPVFSEGQLVQILQHLLKEGIFESKHKAQSVFPELFPPPIVQEAVETVTESSMPDRTDSIMEEQRTWLRKLLDTGIYSDIELVSTHKLYELHRTVVCSWSPVIRRSCQYNAARLHLAETKTSESSNDTGKALFNFGDADPQAVDCVVQFFYLWDYNIPSPMSNDNDEVGALYVNNLPAEETATPDGSHLILHSKVFTLAHTYDISRLGDLSVEKFKAVAQSQWRSKGLLDAAREAYAATPSAVSKMREAIVEAFYEHRELLDEDYVKEFLLEMPHLTLDIMTYMNNKPSPSLGFGASRWPA